MPARGDFLSRRVPASIAPAWETWLQALTAGVKQSGERGWQDVWLTAPLWHFTLGRLLVPPHGAAGILLASVDRVGRLFPFTLIGAAAQEAERDAAAWSGEAEALALQALDDAFDPAALDHALARLGPPPPPRATEAALGAWPLDEAAPGPAPAQSEWWTRGSDRVDPVRLRCRDLPAPGTAVAMVLGGLEQPV